MVARLVGGVFTCKQIRKRETIQRITSPWCRYTWPHSFRNKNRHIYFFYWSPLPNKQKLILTILHIIHRFSKKCYHKRSGQFFPLRNSVDRFLSALFSAEAEAKSRNPFNRIMYTFVFLLWQCGARKIFSQAFCFCLFDSKIVDLFLRMMKLFRHFLFLSLSLIHIWCHYWESIGTLSICWRLF